MTQASTRQLGKYEIVEELGKGGFATVYRARDPDLDREVALKVLDPLLTRDPVWVARFRREARAVARLDHPHVVTIYEVGEAHGMLYIVNRLVEGGSLAGRIREEGPLPWDEVVRLTGEIAGALDYAHGAGVVHRDLKAGNVLLDGERGVQLTDFGFASIVSESTLSASISGGVVGTPQYIAPEIWEGQPATPQADIYALGCILYEMVVGKHLFQGDTTPSVMLAHFQPVTLPEAWPEGVPPGLEAVLQKALAKVPGERYARAGELAGALSALKRSDEVEWAALRREAEALLDKGDLESATQKLEALSQMRPDHPQVQSLRARLEEERALAEMYQEAREHLQVAVSRSEAILAQRADYPDPDSVFDRLQLRKLKASRRSKAAQRPKRAREEAKGARVVPSQAVRKTAWWLLGISVLLGLPALGSGIIGIVGAIAMLKGRPWGRKVGLSFALLFEAAGLVTAFLIVLFLNVERHAPRQATSSWLWCVAAIISMSAGIILAFLLSCETVVRGMGGEPSYVAGGWAMAVPASLTVVGIPPIIGLLRNRRWGRVAVMVFLVIFALTVIVGAILAQDGMRIRSSSYDGSYEYYHNDWGMSIAIVEAAVVALWCLAGILYLNSRRVRAWFETHDDGAAQEARA